MELSTERIFKNNKTLEIYFHLEQFFLTDLTFGSTQFDKNGRFIFFLSW